MKTIILAAAFIVGGNWSAVHAQAVEVVDWQSKPAEEHTAQIPQGNVTVNVDAIERCLVQVLSGGDVVAQVVLPLATGGQGQDRFSHHGGELVIAIRRFARCDVYISVM